MEPPNSLLRWRPTSNYRGLQQKKTLDHSSKLWFKKNRAKISLLTASGRLFEKWYKLSKTLLEPGPKWWWCLATSQINSCRLI